jgi:hypothetical protein
MFPDDDTTFDKYFFINFQNLNKNFSYITSIYNNNSKKLFLGKIMPENKIINENHLFQIGSPNQIILYKQVKNLFFDEQLGLGAKYGSCEDYDIFIRLLKNGNVFLYTNKLYSFHPSKFLINKSDFKIIIKKYSSYSKGYIYFIFKYKKYNLIPKFLLRSIGGSFYSLLLLKFKMSFAYFLIFLIRLKQLVHFSFFKKF